MKIEMSAYLSPTDIDLTHYSSVFCGTPTDERGNFVYGYFAEQKFHIYTTRYDCVTQELTINGRALPPQELSSIAEFFDENVLIDATTLGTAELILLTRTLVALGCAKIAFLYIEPEKYQRINDGGNCNLVSKRDFDITAMRNNYESLPGFNYQIVAGENVVTFFAGFEGQRMSQAFEEHDITPTRTTVVFGVPAFRPGWEMDSFANHVGLLLDRNVKTRHHFCAANNPYLAYQYLEDKYSHKTPKERLFVIPLGTKPQTVGIAAFLSKRPDVGLIYDFPQNVTKYSEGISKCHYFVIGD